MSQPVLVSDAAVEPLDTTAAKDFLRVDHDDENDLIDTLIKSARRKVERRLRRALIDQTWVQVFGASEFTAGVELWHPPLIGVEAVEYWRSVSGTTVKRGRGARLVVTDSPDKAVLDRPLTGITSCRVTAHDRKGGIVNKNLGGTVTPTATTTEFSSVDSIPVGTYFVDWEADGSEVWSTLTDFDVDYFSLPATVKPRAADLPSVDSEVGCPWFVKWRAGYGAAATDIPEHIVHAVKIVLGFIYENRGEVNTDVMPETAEWLLMEDIVPHKL